jgi:hypothetical protein
MRRFLLLLLFGALTLVAAPKAHADPTFYPHGSKGDNSSTNMRIDIAQYGNNYALTMPDDMGPTACGALRRGSSEDSLIEMGLQEGFPRNVAKVTVWSAEYHFCPEYY